MKKAAVSACLTGERCRYDATDNAMPDLLSRLKERGYEIVPFCPEDFAFGSPRPTMDLVAYPQGLRAISNRTGEDLSEPVMSYAKSFFDRHSDIALFVGKDRSPSCGVCTAKCYDQDKKLVSANATGLMAAEAKRRGVESVDAEAYLKRES